MFTAGDCAWAAAVSPVVQLLSVRSGSLLALSRSCRDDTIGVVPSECEGPAFIFGTVTRFLIALLTLALAPRVNAQPRHEYAELRMGVETRIVVYASDANAARAARSAFARIAALEDVMSDWRPTSEVRRLDQRPGRWVRVSRPLFDILSRAVAIARATDGAFDPTVGPVVALWREARTRGRLPDSRALDSARTRVSWRLIGLDSTRRRVRLATAGMRIDLGGIAKGWILQDALAELARLGVTRALIEAGGDLVVGDAPPGRSGWCIAVAGADSSLSARAATITHAAVATSGAESQFVEIDGVRYSHVVDPRTGLGLTNGLTATVIAPHGASADALATALTVLGTRHAQRVLARFPNTFASVR